jgi:hypothetical protein
VIVRSVPFPTQGVGFRATADHRLGRGAFRGTRSGVGRVLGLSWARRSRPGPPGAHPSAPAAGVLSPVHLDRVAFWGWLGGVHYRIMGLLGRPYPTRAHARTRRDRRGSGARRLAVVPSSPLAAPWILGVIGGIGTWAAPRSWCPVPAGHGPARGPCPWGGLAVIIRERGWVWRVGTTAGRVAPGSDGLVANRRAPASGTAGRATPGFGSAPSPATHAT